MTETILVSVGLLAVLVVVGVALYVLVSKVRAAQDRRDYAGTEGHAEEDPDATGERPRTGPQ